SAVAALEKRALSELQDAGLKPEYVEICDGITLQKVQVPSDHTYIVACLAVWAGKVRLIDNLVLKGGPD
ncbi:MAG: pantoate--beta-alanine ligase, partial [Bacteroidota bacterium]|nr:pantoate--beta-alanine ligase [Bacteroidota bacterium]